MTKGDFKKNVADFFISAAEQPEEPQKAEGFTVPKGYRLEKEYKSARMQLLIRPNTKDAIKAEAQALGISMNDLVNNILDEHVERQAKV